MNDQTHKIIALLNFCKLENYSQLEKWAVDKAYASFRAKTREGEKGSKLNTEQKIEWLLPYYALADKKQLVAQLINIYYHNLIECVQRDLS